MRVAVHCPDSIVLPGVVGVRDVVGAVGGFGALISRMVEPCVHVRPPRAFLKISYHHVLRGEQPKRVLVSVFPSPLRKRLRPPLITLFRGRIIEIAPVRPTDRRIDLHHVVRNVDVVIYVERTFPFHVSLDDERPLHNNRPVNDDGVLLRSP